MGKELFTPLTKEVLKEGDSSLVCHQFQGVGKVESGFVTGLHGLEYRVINIVQSELNTNRVTGALRHSHIHISHAHPDAIRARTRKGNGVDINRQFVTPGDTPSYPGARVLRNMVSASPITYIFSFHEDHPDPQNPQDTQRPFYVYDIPRPNSNKKTDRLVDRLHKNLIASLSRFGFSVFTGIDDPGDANLGVEFKNGYGNAPSTVYDASFETHMVDLGARGHGTVERAFVFEIPGHASPLEKQAHVGQIFGSFILPFLSEALPLP
jgi:hypothetical protein